MADSAPTLFDEAMANVTRERREIQAHNRAEFHRRLAAIAKALGVEDSLPSADSDPPLYWQGLMWNFEGFVASYHRVQRAADLLAVPFCPRCQRDRSLDGRCVTPYNARDDLVALAKDVTALDHCTCNSREAGPCP